MFWAHFSHIFYLKPCILFRYVRIGNGNQLVRDPKKRIRVLASEKVRWSLRTARLRLARKRKYCQFFTRFGKCNKDDGKCPYIHDPSKIVVCTKFLTGSCTNINCKLTHKVISDFCLTVYPICVFLYYDTICDVGHAWENARLFVFSERYIVHVIVVLD